MKLRRALAILALLAVAILPVAAAPVVVTGDITTGWITDGTNWTVSADWNLYAKATVDDWVSAYVNFGRALQTYSAAYNATANSIYENVNNQYVYGSIDVAKFFALDKMMALTYMTGFYYTTNGAYESKLFAAYPRIAYLYTSTAPAWWMQVNASIPGVAGVKFGAQPVKLSAAGAPYAFSNDWIVVLYTNQNLGFATVNADATYYQNSNATLGNGKLAIAADFNMTAAPLVVNAGVGFEMNLATAGNFMYGATGKVTFNLDPKNTTFVGGAVGIRGTNTNALDFVEVDAFATFLPLMDILFAATMDLSNATTPFRSADTALRFNIGTTDVYLGYLYGANVGAVWASGNLANGGMYLKAYVPF